MMDIIIINPDSGYGRFSVEWPFIRALNLRDFGSQPNMELGTDMPLPNLELDVEKDIISFWVVTFVCWLLNGVGL
jgi:hypothetical protein